MQCCSTISVIIGARRKCNTKVVGDEVKTNVFLRIGREGKSPRKVILPTPGKIFRL